MLLRCACIAAHASVQHPPAQVSSPPLRNPRTSARMSLDDGASNGGESALELVTACASSVVGVSKGSAWLCHS